jgi:hypothetical protein
MGGEITTHHYQEEDRLQEAIASFEQARNAGADPDPRQWLACYPEVELAGLVSKIANSLTPFRVELFVLGLCVLQRIPSSPGRQGFRRHKQPG